MGRRRLVLVLVGALVAALLPATAAQAAPRCFGKRATIVGTSGNDRLVGTPGPDVIFGRGGQDVILGRGGNDRICGGTGSNVLRGGAGRDRLTSGLDQAERGSTMYGGKGHDILLGTTQGDTMYGGPGNDVLRAGDGLETYWDELHGGPGDDVLEQGAEGAILVPGPGDDRVDGGSNDFTQTADGRHLTDPDYLDLSAAPGPLHVDLQEGIATGQGTDEIRNVETVIGGAFDDTIVGGGLQCCVDGTTQPTNENLYGMGGNDVLAGGFGHDFLVGDAAPGSSFIEQEPGDDTLIGYDGNDVLRGGGGDDEYVGGAGEDTVTFAGAVAAVRVDLAAGQASGEGADTLRGVENVMGTAFDDTLIGDEGDNRLDGARGSDTLQGAGGNDTLVAPVNDEPGRLEGGVGTDTVSYRCLGTVRTVESDLQLGSDNIGNVLIDIENLSSDCIGTFLGDDGPNRLDAHGELFGRGGDDVLIGGTRDDYLHGGEGNDVLDGGAGTDTCVEGETLIRCEP